MIASVAKEDLAVATGSECFVTHVPPLGLTKLALPCLVTYLFRTSGQVLGVSLGGALLQTVLTQKLRERITGPHAVEVRWPHSWHTLHIQPPTDILPLSIP
jgi:hypothetical protein